MDHKDIKKLNRIDIMIFEMEKYTLSPSEKTF